MLDQQDRKRIVAKAAHFDPQTGQKFGGGV